MHVCMYVCIYVFVCMCVCMYLSTSASLNFLCVCIYIHIFLFISFRIFGAVHGDIGLRGHQEVEKMTRALKPQAANRNTED